MNSHSAESKETPLTLEHIEGLFRLIAAEQHASQSGQFGIKKLLELYQRFLNYLSVDSNLSPGRFRELQTNLKSHMNQAHDYLMRQFDGDILNNIIKDIEQGGALQKQLIADEINFPNLLQAIIDSHAPTSRIDPLASIHLRTSHQRYSDPRLDPGFIEVENLADECLANGQFDEGYEHMIAMYNIVRSKPNSEEAICYVINKMNKAIVSLAMTTMQNQKDYCYSLMLIIFKNWKLIPASQQQNRLYFPEVWAIYQTLLRMFLFEVPEGDSDKFKKIYLHFFENFTKIQYIFPYDVYKASILAMETDFINELCLKLNMAVVRGDFGLAIFWNDLILERISFIEQRGDLPVGRIKQIAQQGRKIYEFGLLTQQFNHASQQNNKVEMSTLVFKILENLYSLMHVYRPEMTQLRKTEFINIIPKLILTTDNGEETLSYFQQSFFPVNQSLNQLLASHPTDQELKKALDSCNEYLQDHLFDCIQISRENVAMLDWIRTLAKLIIFVKQHEKEIAHGQYDFYDYVLGCNLTVSFLHRADQCVMAANLIEAQIYVYLAGELLTRYTSSTEIVFEPSQVNEFIEHIKSSVHTLMDDNALQKQLATFFQKIENVELARVVDSITGSHWSLPSVSSLYTGFYSLTSQSTDNEEEKPPVHSPKRDNSQ